MRNRRWIAGGVMATVAAVTAALAADPPPGLPLPGPVTPNAQGWPPVPVLPPAPAAVPVPAPAPPPLSLPSAPPSGLAPPLPAVPPLPADATAPPPVVYPTLPPAEISVTGPDPVLVRAVQAEVRFQYKELAREFLGDDARPHPSMNVSVNGPDARLAGLSVTRDVPVTLKGSYEDVLGKQLRPRLLPAVLGTGTSPAPAWVEAGLGALAFRSADEQRTLDRLNRERVAAGKALTLVALFARPDAGADEGFVAQSHAVARFLSQRKWRGDRPLKTGTDLVITTDKLLGYAAAANGVGQWERATRGAWGFDSVEEMQDHWLLWLKRPASRLDAPAEALLSTVPTPKPGAPETIPATPVAGSDPKPRPRLDPSQMPQSSPPAMIPEKR